MARWTEVDRNWKYREFIADKIADGRRINTLGKSNKPSKYGKRLPLRKRADAPPVGFSWIGDTLCADGLSPLLPKKLGGNASRGRRHGDPIRRTGLDPSLLSNDD
jgi:hypothetical protein